MRGLLVFMAAAAGVCIYVTSQHLPPVVASHFNMQGQPNGHQSRNDYLGLMLLVGCLLPLLVGLGTGFVLKIPGARINIPNRDYWLAPARRAETLRYLQSRMAGFGIVLTIFIAYVNLLVVRANAVQPPALPEVPFFGGLVVFMVLLLGWMATLRLHFRVRR
jgi:hypothetical protein